jgi:hypothetical protein
VFVTLTVKAAAESHDEQMMFADLFNNLRAHMVALRTEEAFGNPKQVELRFLVDGGILPTEEERITGVPDVE